eukprot:1870755-Amphidinium_carterae.1
MVTGGASGLLRATLGKGQLTLLWGPQNLRILLGRRRGRYRRPRVWARGPRQNGSKRSGLLQQLCEKGQAQKAGAVHPKLLAAQPLRLAGLSGDSSSIGLLCLQWRPGCGVQHENVVLVVCANRA